MSGRPEADGGAYEYGYDLEVWQKFTPWRPGDPSTVGEAPMSAADQTLEGRRWTPEPAGREHGEPDHGEQGGSTPQRCGRWWSEDVSRGYESGDRVRNQRAAGSGAFSTVQPGTRGEVLSTRSGLLGDKFATVQFENGYTEEVRTGHLERRGWLD